MRKYNGNTKGLVISEKKCIGLERGYKNKKIIIPNSVTTIGEKSFPSQRLKNIIVSNSVKEIGEYAFWFNRLKKVIIPNSVTTIGEQAFAYNQLKEVKIPENTYVHPNAFDKGVNIIRY